MNEINIHAEPVYTEEDDKILDTSLKPRETRRSFDYINRGRKAEHELMVREAENLILRQHVKTYHELQELRGLSRKAALGIMKQARERIASRVVMDSEKVYKDRIATYEEMLIEADEQYRHYDEEVDTTIFDKSGNEHIVRQPRNAFLAMSYYKTKIKILEAMSELQGLYKANTLNISVNNSKTVNNMMFGTYDELIREMSEVRSRRLEESAVSEIKAVKLITSGKDD